MLEDVLPCKTTLTVNAIKMKSAKTSQSKSTWNPGAHIKNTVEYHGNKGTLFCYLH